MITLPAPIRSRVARAAFFVLVFSVAISLPALAQWPADPLVNLAIADRLSEQVVPKIACTPAGDTYVAWFDLASGNYDVYLQRLDQAGVEQWAHNGILISNHQQGTSLVDWDLIVDHLGNAIVTFTDTRAGGDLDVYAYKVSPAGAMLWGADGIALSNNADYEPNPRVCEATDGDLVFVWMKTPNTGPGTIQMQRLAPDGTPRFAAGGIAVIAPATERPGFADLVPSLDGSVILGYIRDMTSYSSPRHLKADRISSLGASLWGGPRVIYDLAPLPLGYQPHIAEDGSGGALLWWHRALGNLYNSLAQHLDSNGNELYPHEGAMASANATRHHIDPSLCYNAATGEAMMFWLEENSQQSQWGLYAQKFTAAGARQWTDTGLELLPIDNLYKFFVRSVSYAGGAMIFLIDEPGGYGNDRVIGMRIDSQGAKLWPGSFTGVSTLLSSKGRLPFAVDDAGAVKLIWEDDRGGTVDVYGQAVNPDGSLGGVPVMVSGGAVPRSAPALFCSPNPFSASTRISGGSELLITDAAGRLIRRLTRTGDHAPSGTIWDGKDDAGRPAPGGIYYVAPAEGTVRGVKVVRTR